MPPKGSQKAKAAEPSTPKAKAKPKQAAPTATASTSTSSSPATPKSTVKKPATPTPTPRKKKDSSAMFKRVEHEANEPLQVHVKFQGEHAQAQQIADGLYGHTLKLEASNAFTLCKTIKLKDGEFEGYEAIIIKPAKPFPFMKLPKEARAQIYSYYFAPSRIMDNPIAIEGKRSNKDIFAKQYSEGSKYRVGLLTVNKEVHEEALPLFYNLQLRVESTTTLLEFFAQLPNTVRPRITKISIKSFLKTSGRNAMHFLAESPNIAMLHIDGGIYAGDDPTKAAKEFYDAAYKFLEAVGGRKGDKTAGVDVLSFGKEAFTYKAGNDKKKCEWDEGMVDEFVMALKAKLKSMQFSQWVCLCGSLVKGHSCADELAGRAQLQPKKTQLKQKRSQVRQKREQWEHIRHGAWMLAALPN